MADFLSRLVERTYGLIQVAEPLITPSFAAEPASVMDYTESPVFDIKHGPDHGVSRPEAPFLPRSITQPVKHPGYNAGIKEDGTVANNQAKNSPFEVTGTQAISGHEQSGFDVPAGTMPEKVGFGRDTTDVTQQMPADAIRINEKTVNHPQRLIHEISEHDEPIFAEDIHVEHADNGENSVNHPQRLIHEISEHDEPVFAEDIHVESAKNGEKTVYHPQRLIHEISQHDEPVFAEDIHVEHARNGEKTVYHPQRLIHEISERDEPVFAEDIHVEHARNGEKTVYHPQPKSIISETPVKDENIPEITRAGIMAAESLHQPERSLKITGAPEDKAAENLKKALTENIRTLKDASDEIPEMINLTDSAEKKSAKHVYRNVTKPGNELQIQGPKFSKQGTLFSERRREIQDSLVSTIAGTPVPGRKLYQDTGTAAYRPPAEKQKHIAESRPEIKVTIGRVEVRALAPPAHPGVPSSQNPVLSLNDYLKKRNGNTL